MNRQKQQRPYTFQNQQQFPFLKNIAHFKQAKQHGQNQPNWKQFLSQTNPLFVKWFNWTGPDFILVQIDQNTKKVKFYQKHSSIKNTTYVSQRKVKGSLVFSQVRTFNQKIQLDIKKNFVNNAITPAFTYNWIKYNQQQSESQLNKVYKFGVKFDFQKWLNNSLITNQKKIFFSLQGNAKNTFFPFQMYQASIFLANRSNSNEAKDKNTIITDSVVKKSSDIIGYSLATYYESIGLQISVSGGYDYFHKYNFNKLMLKYGNFREFEKHVVQLSVRGGAIYGKNLMQNDLFARSKSKWVDDRSTQFMSARLNFIFKNFHPIFGGVFQIVPLFYIQGCTSRNTKQIKTKYELDYGIGLRFLNVGLTLDTSLLRIGKNLDDINPSIRIVF